jgi:hypothetical protein
MCHPRNLIPTLTLLTALVSVAACTGHDHPTSGELSFWTVGSEGSAFRFGTDLYPTLESERDAIEPILLAVAEQPLSDDQILERTDLSGARLSDLLSTLSALHVIAKDGEDRWATTLPVITDDQMGRIRQSLIPMARAVAQRIGGEAPRLSALYDEVRSASDPSWEDVAHLIVDKFLIDGSFHTAIGRLGRERGVREQYYSPDQQIIPAFFMERGDNFSTFGSNWYPFIEGDGQREVYVLHGAVFKRYEIRMNAHRGDPVLSAALFGISPAGGIESLAENEKDALRALDWTQDDRLLVPVVQATTIKSLGPMLEEIGTAAADVVFENHSIIIDAFDRSPYAAFLDGGGDYLQVCYHGLFGLVLEQLAATGVVPEFPEPVPEHFGVYIIMGRLF